MRVKDLLEVGKGFKTLAIIPLIDFQVPYDLYRLPY